MKRRVVLFLILFLVGCVKVDLHSELNSCIDENPSWHFFKIEHCFYETLKSANAEAGFEACSLFTGFSSSCLRVLNQIYPSESLLQKALSACKEIERCRADEIMLSSGDSKQCESVKIKFKDQKPDVISYWYEKCLKDVAWTKDLIKVYEAVSKEDIQLCKDLEPRHKNICAYRIAEKTRNTNYCKTEEEGGIMVEPVGDDVNFAFHEFCKCDIGKEEPTIFCIHYPGYGETSSRCDVKNSTTNEIIETFSAKTQAEEKKKRSKYASCSTSWGNSINSGLYDFGLP